MIQIFLIHVLLLCWQAIVNMFFKVLQNLQQPNSKCQLLSSVEYGKVYTIWIFCSNQPQ